MLFTVPSPNSSSHLWAYWQASSVDRSSETCWAKSMEASSFLLWAPPFYWLPPSAEEEQLNSLRREQSTARLLTMSTRHNRKNCAALFVCMCLAANLFNKPNVCCLCSCVLSLHAWIGQPILVSSLFINCFAMCMCIWVTCVSCVDVSAEVGCWIPIRKIDVALEFLFRWLSSFMCSSSR